MPIGHWIDASRLQPERMHLLSFAGTTHPYPERQQFIERLTEINGGRAFYTTNESLGDYVLVDFLEHRRRMTQRQAG